MWHQVLAVDLQGRAVPVETGTKTTIFNGKIAILNGKIHYK